MSAEAREAVAPDFDGLTDIYKPTGDEERCRSHLNLAGSDYRCDLARKHDGWAHSSKAAQAIWGHQ